MLLPRECCRRQLYLSRRAHSEHAAQCDPKCCRTTGQETEHLNFPPRTSLQGYARGSPSAAATLGEHDPMLQHKSQVSSSARRKACGQERHEQDAAGAGTALVSHTPVCPSDPLCTPIPDAIRVLSQRCRGCSVLANGSRPAPCGFTRMETQKHWRKLSEKPQGCLQGCLQVIRTLPSTSSVTALNREILDGE